MSKKSFIIKLIIFVVLFAMMMPSFASRIKSEKKNKDVVIALNYNNAEMLLSRDEMTQILTQSKENGADTVLVAEESLNSLISAGYVSAIKYNVLRHKYDDESEEIIKQISDDGKIHNDSYVIITKRDECKKYLEKWIPAKYTDSEYKKMKTDIGADVYVLYEGVGQAWQVSVGIDENKLKNVVKSGLTPALAMEVGAHKNTEYVEKIGELCEKYDVKFLNLKPDYKAKDGDKYAKENIGAFCKLIKEKELFLVLTEEPTQLSNQNPIGYKKMIESAQGRVLRGYDAIDFDQENTGATSYKKYYSQIVNSVVDRNIRFVAVRQLVNGTDSLKEKGEKTNEVVLKISERLNSMGYNTNTYSTVYDYEVNRTVSSIGAILLIILMGLMMLEWLCQKALIKIRIFAVIGSVAAVLATFAAPEGILTVYPTLFAVVAPCFGITAVLAYIRKMNGKCKNKLVFFVSSAVIAVIVMLVCATVQASLLSGLDYYLNILIFRGIKLSLIVPILYGFIAFQIMMSENPREIFRLETIKKFLLSDIKVYWILIAGAAIAVGAIYLIRSGNVTSISSVEALMRNTITDLMDARPRTKEFLVGWPAFVLFLYYMINTKSKFLQWVFATAGTVLFASVMNSFCHVFTGAGIIYMRVVNGIIVGAIVSAAVLIVNHIIVLSVKKYILKEGH